MFSEDRHLIEDNYGLIVQDQYYVDPKGGMYVLVALYKDYPFMID